MIIAVLGKGGVGKTTIASLLLRRLLDRGETPVLAVDADPSSCLGAALRIDVDRTLADLRDTMRDNPERSPSVSQTDWLSLRAEEALVERRGFDLLTMGHPEGPGCYCFVNNLIRSYLDRLGRSYRHVLIDCEAGLEHLSRRSSGRPDSLVCVSNRSRMGAVTIGRALAIYRHLHATLPRLELILNGFRPGEPLAEQAVAAAASDGATFARVIAVPWDPAVAEADAAGRSTLELEAGTPAFAALCDWEPLQ
jgi:CO dehydrogenase maturation factor